MVIINKGTIDTWGIRLLDILWKVVEALIDTRLCARLQVHDVLYRFRAGICTGTYIMELKFAPKLSSLDRNPVFLVFLDLKKAYDTVKRERLFLTLERYGVRPFLCVLLETFSVHQQVVPRHNGFHRTTFPITRLKLRVTLYLQHSSTWSCTMPSRYG